MSRRPGWALVGLLLAGCQGDPGAPGAPPAPTSAQDPFVLPPATGQPRLPTATARIGGVALEVELARTAEQRAAGLRDRTVAPGTGMAFLYPGGVPVRFTMAGVEQPLVAVFARDGRALSVEQLVPCPGTAQQCPTYGPDSPVDVVVEAAPGSLPAARAGDAVELDAAGG